MTGFIILTVLIIIFGGFLYWAYLPDYRRNPKEFWRTLIGMPIGILLSALGYDAWNHKIKKWAVGEKNEKKTKE
ncbi:hypothetical protein ACJD0Z_06875 [Flavobacteriaceae bacterium M23B6Z8]